MMREKTEASACEYSNDLISFVYSELSDKESQEFKLHLNTCQQCSAELDTFGEMREAIGAWKYQSLAGVSVLDESPDVQRATKKSAVGAIRAFFDLSPLWMKGAVGVASVLFCVLVVLATLNFNQRVSIAPVGPTAKTYTQKEVDEILAKARAESSSSKKSEVVANNSDGTKSVQPIVQKRRTDPQKLARSKRPLSRSEREQLAVDLRLTGSGNDDTVHLISDKINED
jgi:anti-sigma factor RsiW